MTVNNGKRPFNKLQSVAINDARWTTGFWANEFEKCHKILLPGMEKAMHDPKNSASLLNFAIAAGLREGRHNGTPWSDADCYKFLEAMAHIYAITKDSELDKIMDHYISEIGAAQMEDGYISTYVQLTRNRFRWDDQFYLELNNMGHIVTYILELFNMGHMMTAACVHFRATGKDSFLNLAVKCGNYLYDVFKSRPRNLVNIDICPANIMGAIDLYRTTGEPNYLELAKIFIDMRGSMRGGSDWSQTRTPIREETQALGHAVEAAFLYCGATDVYVETGEQAIIDAINKIWENMVHSKLYVTGAIGAWHSGVSQHYQHGAVHVNDYVKEAFGKDYELPNRTAYNEGCANNANAMFNYRLLNITGDAKYADEMERVIYNSMLSEKDTDGLHFFYTNPLARADKTIPLLTADTAQRWSAFGCYCCPPNLARTIAELHEWVYGLGDNGVYVHLYGGSELSTELPGKGRIQLVQEAQYPWSGEITLKINEAPADSIAIRLRIPGWSDGGVISVNGKRVDIDAVPATYAKVERIWKKGDTIQLSLPMRIRAMRAHPLVEETRGRVCMTRGPVVYCLEAVDLPQNVKLNEIYLPARQNFAPRHDNALFGGVTVLEGKAYQVVEDSWDGKLYQESAPPQDQMVPVTLIPYYGWSNRGESEMTVWLPVL